MKGGREWRGKVNRGKGQENGKGNGGGKGMERESEDKGAREWKGGKGQEGQANGERR